MPQLSSEEQAIVRDATNVMTEGIYEMILTKVTEGANDKGAYWLWEFTMPEDAEKYKGWKVSLFTSRLPEKAFWFKKAFKAFGVDETTNTDDLIGQRVRVNVGVYTQTKAGYEGEVANNVKYILPLEGGSGNGVGDSLFS
jgi:hypothetical protein